MDSRELYHIGVKRRSGRYPWGSGERPYQSGGGPSGGKRPGLPRIIVNRKKKTVKEPESEKKESSSSTQKKKSVKDMSDDELRKAINRLDLEKQYLSKLEEVSRANQTKVADVPQKKKSAGRRFASHMLNRVVIPVADEILRNELKNAINGTLHSKKKSSPTVSKPPSSSSSSENHSPIGLPSSRKKKKK